MTGLKKKRFKISYVGSSAYQNTLQNLLAFLSLKTS